jgi:hypothetical protein
MARSRPENPAWLRESQAIIARPLDIRFAPGAERFTIACTVVGRSPVFLIAWWARDFDAAETTFRAWLSEGWAMMSRTFFDEPCRYVFRTGAVTGFVVLPPKRDEILDDLFD